MLQNFAKLNYHSNKIIKICNCTRLLMDGIGSQKNATNNYLIRLHRKGTSNTINQGTNYMPTIQKAKI